MDAGQRAGESARPRGTREDARRPWRRTRRPRPHALAECRHDRHPAEL